MQVFQFGPDVARRVTDYASSFQIAPLLMATHSEVRVHCIHLQPHDWIGFHEGRMPQLFCITHGSGWVEGHHRERLAINAGHAAFWDAGEGHAAGTDSGMTAIAIQSEELDPAAFLTPVSPATNDSYQSHQSS